MRSLHQNPVNSLFVIFELYTKSGYFWPALSNGALKIVQIPLRHTKITSKVGYFKQNPINPQSKRNPLTRYWPGKIGNTPQARKVDQELSFIEFTLQWHSQIFFRGGFVTIYTINFFFFICNLILVFVFWGF